MRFDKERFETPDPLARAIILTADKFEDLELFVPYLRLMEEGVVVDVAAPAKETITGENGYFFENVDLTIDEVDRSCTTSSSSPAEIVATRAI